MKRAGAGRIVLVSSAAGLSASPTAALSYSVTKAAIAALPRLLAAELGAFQVLVNAVAPGKFENPQWPDDPSAVERYAATVPLGRIGSTEEVAALIGFLSSDANTYVTGQTILQDGGRLSAPPGAPRR
jgi:3-oxoacyl-[acyl-carrier protein] reductase